MVLGERIVRLGGERSFDEEYRMRRCLRGFVDWVSRSSAAASDRSHVTDSGLPPSHCSEDCHRVLVPGKIEIEHAPLHPTVKPRIYREALTWISCFLHCLILHLAYDLLYSRSNVKAHDRRYLFTV